MRALLLSMALVAGASGHAALDQTVTLRPAGGGWALPATLVIPEAADPVPCVVFFAGSGPTDRDWRSPLLRGSNGSGRQLAEGLATKGIGSLRFDKVGSGANMDHLEMLSLGHYVDEASVAFDYLV